jgi:hypothetical protein
MTTNHRRISVVASACVLALFATSVANAKPKAPKPKKKKAPVAAGSKPAAGGGTKNFSCIGANEQRVTERLVTGTVDTNIAVTNVTVTQTHQLIDNTLVEQPVVVLTVANPPGTPDPGSDLIVFRLNERPVASATDVDTLFTQYQFNFHNKLAPGPSFEAGLYFSTLKGIKGPANNEYRWGTVSSLAYSGAYTMKCTYT